MSFFGLRRCKFPVELRSGYLGTRDEKSGLAEIRRTYQGKVVIGQDLDVY